MQPILGKCKDVPNFIYGIARQIADERGIDGKLHRYWAKDLCLRSATDFTQSNASATAQQPWPPCPAACAAIGRTRKPQLRSLSRNPNDLLSPAHPHSHPTP